MDNNIRFANIDDVPQMLHLYSYYVKETCITFEVDVPTVEVFRERFLAISNLFPWIVYEKDGIILGYAYANKLRDRSAYRWTVELSVYLDKDFVGKGLGNIIYSALLNILKENGYYNAYGIITLPNKSSTILHKKLGFALVGKWSGVGYKFNQWLDVAIYELKLREKTDEIPLEPTKN